MDCKSEEEFHSALNEVNKRWPILHNNAKHFLPYFVKGLADVIKDSMRADIRSMCGLGFPPTTYSQNAIECLNRYVKENAKSSEDVTSSLVEVVKNISDVQTIKPTAFVHIVLLSLSKTGRLTTL